MGRLRTAGHCAVPARRTADAGFTLIEVMVAMLIFVLVSTATVAILIQGLKTLRESSDRVMAANIARSELEYLRSLGTSNIPIGLMVGAIPPGEDATLVDPNLLNSAFTIRTTSNWVGFDQQVSSCDAVTPGQAYLRVSVEVSSANLGAPATLDTVIFPDGVANEDNTGLATIAVLDELAQPVSDVLVTITDPSHAANNLATMTTGLDGCLFIPNLTPTFALSVTISRSGFVSSTPTGTHQTLAITAGDVTRSSFEYAAAAQVQFTGSDPDFPLAPTMPVTWQTSGIGGSPTAGSVDQVLTGLWPGSQIEAWAGSCTDADPLGYSGQRDTYALAAGKAVIAALPSVPLKLRGLPADELVTAHYVGTDAACTITPIELGRSGAKGILKVGMPYGAWEFTAAGETQPLVAALVPPTPELPLEVVVVNFTLANLDNPSPTATPLPSGSGNPSTPASPAPAPAPSGSP